MSEETILSRSPLERMQVILALVRSGVFPNATQMARCLEVSTKCIHRDIEFMRDRLLFDIRYDGSRFGYFMPEGPIRCPFCNPLESVLVGREIGRKPEWGEFAEIQHRAFQSPMRRSNYRGSVR